ncbi:MAG: hypothetical protein ACLPVY_18420 [Acidimicrobiia bacterium]
MSLIVGCRAFANAANDMRRAVRRTRSTRYVVLLASSDNGQQSPQASAEVTSETLDYVAAEVVASRVTSGGHE